MSVIDLLVNYLGTYLGSHWHIKATEFVSPWIETFNQIHVGSQGLQWAIDEDLSGPSESIWQPIAV